MKSIRIDILGREYPLRVEASNEAQTRRIAAYVNQKMQDFRRAHGDQPEVTTAVITALAIAEELFTLRAEHAALADALDALDDELAEALPSDAPHEPAASAPTNGASSTR